MRGFKAISNGINGISQWSGRIVSWIGVVLVVSISYDVILRYIFNAPTNWSFTLSYMLGGTMFALGQGDVQRQDAHARVDLLYTKFSDKTKLIIDTFFTIVFLIPVFGYLSYSYWVDFARALAKNEKAIESTWYPLTWPYKLLIAVGFSWFVIQGCVTLAGYIHRLMEKGRSDD